MLNLLETDQCDILKKATLKYSFIPTARVRIKFDLHYSQRSTFKIDENFWHFLSFMELSHIPYITKSLHTDLWKKNLWLTLHNGFHQNILFSNCLYFVPQVSEIFLVVLYLSKLPEFSIAFYSHQCWNFSQHIGAVYICLHQLCNVSRFLHVLLKLNHSSPLYQCQFSTLLCNLNS